MASAPEPEPPERELPDTGESSERASSERASSERASSERASPVASEPSPVASAPPSEPVDSVIPPEVRVAGSEEPRRDGGLGWRLMGLLKTLRPHQWVKNVFVLAPVVFAKEIFDPTLLFRASAAFLAFCMLAGAVYTMNDLADVEADRQHPVKRFRPIASGRVPGAWARLTVVALVVGVLVGSALRTWGFFAVAVAYFALNVGYSFKLKHIAYLDVGCIAAGFVLRVMGGGSATQIHVSYYLLACTALLALFLGFGKRRHEFALAKARGGKTRAALESYTARGIDLALSATGVATVLIYLAYTLDRGTEQFFHTHWLWPSTAFVILGVWRFLHLVRSRPRAESPTQEMLKDGPFVGIVLLWVVLVLVMVYQLRPS